MGGNTDVAGSELLVTFGDVAEASAVIERFKKPRTDEEIFYELCFCLCTPQTTFKKNIEVLDSLKKFGLFNKMLSADCLNLRYDFLDGKWFSVNARGEENNIAVVPIPKLESLLKPVRFYKVKAGCIIKMMEDFFRILHLVRLALQNGHASEFNLRTWLVKNVKGLGYKTASHFLRNLGADGFAIIDSHILKYMGVRGKWDYLEVEKRFRGRAKKYGMTAAELDAIIWKTYSKTDWEDFSH